MSKKNFDHLLQTKIILLMIILIFLFKSSSSQKVNTCLKIVRDSGDENGLMNELEKRMHEIKNETNL
jgi:hypothetical protein